MVPSHRLPMPRRNTNIFDTRLRSRSRSRSVYPICYNVVEQMIGTWYPAARSSDHRSTYRDLLIVNNDPHTGSRYLWLALLGSWYRIESRHYAIFWSWKWRNLRQKKKEKRKERKKSQVYENKKKKKKKVLFRTTRQDVKLLSCHCKGLEKLFLLENWSSAN